MSLKILIIDDDQMLVDLISLKIKKWGMSPSYALNTKDGLKLINEENYDLVLLDINLGDDSGVDLLNEIRKRWDQNHLPVVMISASQNDKDLVLTLSKGANDFVLKPINESILYARILTQLEHASLSKDFARLKQYEAVKAVIVACHHEFNNPLMIASGSLTQIERLYEIDEKHIDRMRKALDRIENLVKKIGKIASDEKSLEFDDYIKDVKKIKIS